GGGGAVWRGGGLPGGGIPHAPPTAGPAGVAGKRITIRHGARVSAIDRAAKSVTTEAGERLGYDALVLATGSINRTLPMFPAGQQGIHYLRPHEEALAPRAELQPATSPLGVGGGL